MDEPSDLKEGITLSYLGLNGVRDCSHEIKNVLFFFQHILCKTGQSKSLGCIFRKQLIQHLTMIHDSFFSFPGT